MVYGKMSARSQQLAERAGILPYTIFTTTLHIHHHPPPPPPIPHHDISFEELDSTYAERKDFPIEHAIYITKSILIPAILFSRYALW